MNTIYYTSGIKGGNGKTFCNFALAYTLEKKGYQPLVIETDADIPDFGRAYKGRGLTVCDLRKEEGWEKLLNKLEEVQNRPIIINSAAGNSESISKYGATLAHFSSRLKLLWAVNTDNIAIDLLERFLEYTEGIESVTFVLSGLFGSPENFLEYNKGEINKKLNEKGIKNESIYVPKLTKESVRSAMYNDGKTLAEALAELSFGEKLIINGWEKRIVSEFKKIIDE